MLGIDDLYVWLAYTLCLLLTLVCVIYGAINWNKGDDSVRPEDLAWAKHEKQVEKEIQ